MGTNSNRQIAKNSLYLYIRMGVQMLVRLYTVSLLLDMLGVDDYGLWNVIMSFVTAVTFISPTLVTSTQRFLTFEMGQGSKCLKRIFSTSFLLFLVVGGLIFIFLETFGVYFVSEKMNIPAGMENEALIVFQFCIITLLIDMLRMPYEAVIIAEERMSFYAIVCILEAFLLLGCVLLLPFFGHEIRIVVYGALTMVAHLGISAAYITHCRRRYDYARIDFTVDKGLMREIGSFSGWNVLGALSSMLTMQGVDLLINVYFGVAVNAAYGVALQVRTAVFIFAVNISKAAAPGIVKYFAKGEISEMQSLVMNISKFTFLLILMLVIPASFNIDTLLSLWLKGNIPQYTGIFSILIMVQVLFVSFTPPMDSAVFATGKIRNFQLVLSALIALNFVLTWICYAIGMDAVSALWIRVIVEVMVLVARIDFLNRLTGLRPVIFIKKTLAPSFIVAALALSTMFLIWNFSDNLGSIIRMCVTSFIFLLIYSVLLWKIVLTRHQRGACIAFVSGKLRRKS